MKTPRSNAALRWVGGNAPSTIMNEMRRIEREHADMRDALGFIAANGGKVHETECGAVMCAGLWCAEQARAALASVPNDEAMPDGSNQLPKTL